jgi:hypothetical protein
MYLILVSTMVQSPRCGLGGRIRLTGGRPRNWAYDYSTVRVCTHIYVYTYMYMYVYMKFMYIDTYIQTVLGIEVSLLNGMCASSMAADGRSEADWEGAVTWLQHATQSNDSHDPSHEKAGEGGNGDAEALYGLALAYEKVDREHRWAGTRGGWMGRVYVRMCVCVYPGTCMCALSVWVGGWVGVMSRHVTFRVA